MKNTPTILKTALLFALVACQSLPEVQAQVTTLQNWTNVYHGKSSAQQTVAYPVETGSDVRRILVVAVTSVRTSNGSMSADITYGGLGLTPAQGDMEMTNTRQHSAIYYLDEAGLDAATDSNLSFTISGGTIGSIDVWAAVFDQVRQAEPIKGSSNYNSLSSSVSSFSFSTPLTIKAYHQAVEVISTLKNRKDPSDITYAPDWTKVLEKTEKYSIGTSPYSIRNGCAVRVIPLAEITDGSPTVVAPASTVSMTAVSLNYDFPPAPVVPASDVTFSNVTSNSFTITWTPGDGSNRLVLLKAGSVVNSSPADGSTYTSSASFGNGSQIGEGNYVVYNGIGNSVNVTNLDGNTTYHVSIFEFSGPAGMEDYLTVNPATGSQLTLPETAQLGDYRTKTSGNWGSTETWETYDGSGWVDASVAPSSADGIITIRTDHTVDVDINVTADQVLVEAAAHLTINPGIILTINDEEDEIDLLVRGRITNSGNISVNGVISFTDGSDYIHNADGGSVPSAEWDAGSKCLIQGITSTAPTGLGQTFGHFTWNCMAQQITSAINADMTVQGDFRLTSSGTGSIAITNDNNSRTLVIYGNYYQEAGTLDLNAGSTSTATSYLNIAGNFSFSGGSLTETSAGRGAVVFNGGGPVQMFSGTGTLSNTIDVSVDYGSWLQMGTGGNPSNITGTNGTFTLSEAATLGITDRYGITISKTGSTAGNIRATGSRTYSDQANYVYNGSVNQNTGDGLAATVNRLVIDNPGMVVTLASAVNATDAFSISAGSMANLGSFTHSTTSLILGGTGQQPGSYGHTNSPATFRNDTFFDDATGIVNNNAPDGTWLGITTEWNEATNWTGGIPTGSSAAVITASVANQPLISGPVTALASSVTIGQNASLTIGPQGSATFASVTNNGTLNLKSDASGTASLILDSYTDNGTENIELFLTGGEAEAGAYRWHYISAPVTPSIPASIFEAHTQDLAQFIEGNYTGTSDEGWIASDGYIYATGSYGQRFYDLVLGRGYDYYSSSDNTFTFDGVLNTSGLENITLAYSGTEPGSENYGFNLLGNPFTSGLSWDVIVNLPDYPLNTSKAVFFTKDNIQYTYVNGVGTPEGANGHIPPMQGFFVKTSGMGNTFKIPLSAREHNSTPRYKGSEGSSSLIRLALSGNGKSDETVIRFDNNAKEGIDYDFDAVELNMRSGSPSITSLAGKTGMIINGIPFPETSAEIPLCVAPGSNASGRLTISARQIECLGDYLVLLTDKSVNKTINLRNTKDYSFDAPERPESGRFVLTVKKNAQGEEMTAIRDDQFMIYNAMELINIKTVSEDWEGLSGTVKLLSITGRPLSIHVDRLFSKDSMIQIEEPDRPGIYLLEISSGQKRFTGKVVVK